MRVCVILPRLPPAIDGVGDYCYRLWQFLARDYQEMPFLKAPWLFLVADGACATQQHYPNLTVQKIEQSVERLADILCENVDLTVVHYVGYGYSKDGAPLWLPRALSRWLELKPAGGIVTLFHETWASGKPWQKVYWLSPRQKQCVRELAIVSHVVVTTNPANAQDLGRVSLKPIDIIPLASAFDVSPLGQVNFSQMLVFGQPGPRLRAVQRHLRLLHLLDKRQALQSIVIAGKCQEPALDKGLSILRQDIRNIEILTGFNIPGNEVPESVRSCGLALMNTESTCLLKSTAFHFAAQLGQVPITLEEHAPGLSLRRNVHYLSYRPGHEGELMSMLSDTSLLKTISSNIRHLAASEFSWSQIALSWADVFRRFISEGVC